MKINHDTIEKHTGRVVIALFGQNVRRATAFLAPDFVVSAARRGPRRKSDNRHEIVLKIGKPNFLEREFVKACKQSGVAFPLREPQLKFWATKVKKKSRHKSRRRAKSIHVISR